MNTYIRRAGILLLLGGVTVAGPGYAFAGPPAPNIDAQEACRAGTGPCAWLYETTENLNMRALQQEHRKAVSALLGFAVRGTPLCPEELMPVIDPLPKYCVLNATGSDNISLKTGLGQFHGTVTVVVQEIVNGIPTPDSPEVVIARGKFTGMMDFTPAILHQVPLGSVKGHLSLDGLSRQTPFTGVFRLPFALGIPDLPPDWYVLNAPEPLPADMKTWVLAPVAPNEMAIGYPAVRFEISF